MIHEQNETGVSSSLAKTPGGESDHSIGGTTIPTMGTSPPSSPSHTQTPLSTTPLPSTLQDNRVPQIDKIKRSVFMQSL